MRHITSDDRSHRVGKPIGGIGPDAIGEKRFRFVEGDDLIGRYPAALGVSLGFEPEPGPIDLLDAIRGKYLGIDSPASDLQMEPGIPRHHPLADPAVIGLGSVNRRDADQTDQANGRQHSRPDPGTATCAPPMCLASQQFARRRDVQHHGSLLLQRTTGSSPPTASARYARDDTIGGPRNQVQLVPSRTRTISADRLTFLDHAEVAKMSASG